MLIVFLIMGFFILLASPFAGAGVLIKGRTSNQKLAGAIVMCFGTIVYIIIAIGWRG